MTKANKVKCELSYLKLKVKDRNVVKIHVKPPSLPGVAGEGEGGSTKEFTKADFIWRVLQKSS